jgi:hypothetical protein
MSSEIGITISIIEKFQRNYLGIDEDETRIISTNTLLIRDADTKLLPMLEFDS